MKKKPADFKFVIQAKNNKLLIWSTLLTKSVSVQIYQPATVIITGKGQVNLSASHKFK